jgi:dTMP kinase
MRAKQNSMAGTGKFITFEGGEGCGKSTLISQVAARLRAAGRTVLTQREPGGTELGEEVRHILLRHKKMAGMVSEAELLLFCASRAQLVRQVIQPALAAGQVVLADRFFDSTTVYQGVGRQIGADTVAAINNFAVGASVPDLTILIDLDPRIGLERAKGRELFDRMESLALDFHQRVRQGYLDLARREPKRIKVVDGSQSLAAVGEQVWRLVETMTKAEGRMSKE